MRKIVLLSGLLAFAAQADDGSTSAKEAVEGFYAGLGICYMHSDDELKITDGDEDGNGTVEQINLKLHNKKANKFGGSLVAGYGAFVSGNFYIGGEVIFDIAGNKDINGEYECGGNRQGYRSKVKGFVPSLAVRLGYWCSPIDSLVYLRAGAASVYSEYQERDNDYNVNTRKMSKLVPLIGFGIEKNLYNHLNVRLEGDYRFRAQKTTETKEKIPFGVAAQRWNVKDHLSGYSIRLMAIYKF